MQTLSQMGKHSLTIFTQISKANSWEQFVALWSCCQTQLTRITGDHFVTAWKSWHTSTSLSASGNSYSVPPSLHHRMHADYPSLALLCTEKMRSTFGFERRWDTILCFKHGEGFLQSCCFNCISPLGPCLYLLLFLYHLSSFCFTVFRPAWPICLIDFEEGAFL